MLTLHNVAKVYPGNKGTEQVSALEGVTLDIPPGEFLVVTGRSGTGKTTLLNLAAGLTRPTAGSVQINGIDWWSLSEQDRSRMRAQKLGFIFQFPSLLPSFTVIENVALPRFFTPAGDTLSVFDKAAELLNSLGLGDKAASYPRQLSAGQQQRAVIARALIGDPELLLADEPTSNLDEKTELEIMELLRQIHDRSKATIILVTHSSQLRCFGTRSITIAAGKVENA